MKYLTLVLVLGLVGCSTVTYKSPTGEQFSSTRIGPRSIQGLKVTKSADGTVEVSLESAKTDTSELASALVNVATKAAK